MSSTTDAKKTSPQGADNVPSGFILKLFQMVNGAPDEVIRWNPDGDAFIIGSDLERLESETLPQYFRHNRFQSLVRQLNFYSFRKINRERNVWIYKHNLFHRDRPEDLYMVRRRTCPGMDGRKQRFSSRKPSTKNADNSDEDSASPPEEQRGEYAADGSSATNTKKRNSLSSVSSDQLVEADYQPRPKKGRTSLTNESTRQQLDSSPVVDTSIIRSVVEANNKVIVPRDIIEAADDSSMDYKRNEKLEMMQQSLIVSDVAMKLEEFAKRAWKDRGISIKSRRAGAGVVTPPFGSSSYQSAISATELLTYDDEYDSGDEDQLRATDLFGIHTTSSVVTADTDVVEEAEEDRSVESQVPKELMAAPVGIPHAKSITERLLVSDLTAAAIAGFCMSTAPNGNPDMSQKILQLIGSCETLAADFHQYRNALKPVAHSGEGANSVTPIHSVRMNHVQNWELEGSRSAAVRDFKVFSVNCVHKILGKNGWSEGVAGLSIDDRGALEQTANVWLKSVGTSDCPRRISIL